MSRSLQRQLLLTTTCATTCVLGMLGLGIYLLVRHSLLAGFDAALIAQARALAALAEQADGSIIVEYDPQQMPEFHPGRHPQFFQMWRQDGSTLFRSPSLRGQDLSDMPSLADGAVWPVRLPNSHKGQAAHITFVPRADPQHAATALNQNVRLVVARESGDLDDTLANLGWLLLASCLIAVIACAALLRWLVRGSLRPVRTLAGEIRSIGEMDLDHRLRNDGLPEELVPVADRLNELLERISAAFAREQAFTADVAHELRTPLAGLQATLEVSRLRPREREAYESALDKCLAIVAPMQQMVEQLLLLARTQSGQLPAQRQEIDLRQLLDEAWTPFAALATRRNLHLHWEVPDACGLTTDSEKLQMILRNLFDNAVSYAEEGGTIRIAMACRSDAVTLSISNSGCQLTSDDVRHAAEPFWRGDRARAAIGGHCGLGLSLCDRLARILGGQLTIRVETGGFFTAELCLPCSGGSDAGRPDGAEG